MKFGGRQLPLPLRVGRMMIYLQCGILLLASAYAVAIAALTGGSSSLVLGGPLAGSNRVIAGGGVAALVAFQIVVAVLVVLLARQASHFSNPARTALVAAEVLLAAYYVGVVSWDISSWLFGPGLSAAVIACHFWRSLQPAYAAAGSSAPESPAAPTGAPLRTVEVAEAAVPPLGAG